MNIKTKIFICMCCNNVGLIKENISHINCQLPFYFLESNLEFKMQLTAWGRFLNWLYSRDIGLGLAIIGLVGLNGMLMQYFSLTLWQSVLEGLCFGLVIPRLLK